MNSPLQIWHPFTNRVLDPTPIRVTRAEGVFLYTADGRKIIDAISSYDHAAAAASCQRLDVTVPACRCSTSEPPGAIACRLHQGKRRVVLR